MPVSVLAGQKEPSAAPSVSNGTATPQEGITKSHDAPGPLGSEKGAPEPSHTLAHPRMQTCSSLAIYVLYDRQPQSRISCSFTRQQW